MITKILFKQQLYNQQKQIVWGMFTRTIRVKFQITTLVITCVLEFLGIRLELKQNKRLWEKFSLPFNSLLLLKFILYINIIKLVQFLDTLT